MANKSVSVIFMPYLVPGLPEKIWAEVKHYESNNWRLPRDQSLLEAIVGLKETARVYGIGSTAQQNIEIRKLLTGALKGNDHELKVRAMNWVVVQWGKIKKGDDAYEVWANELKNFDKDSIDRFIEQKNEKRVSSWSKILAFADSENYAIYDSYVALALNTILEKLGRDDRFFMPQSQSKPVNNRFQEMKAHVALQYVGTHPVYMRYFDYMYLLKYFVDAGLVKNVLEAEMCLFAQGRELRKTLPR